MLIRLNHAAKPRARSAPRASTSDPDTSFVSTETAQGWNITGPYVVVFTVCRPAAWMLSRSLIRSSIEWLPTGLSRLRLKSTCLLSRASPDLLRGTRPGKGLADVLESAWISQRTTDLGVRFLTYMLCWRTRRLLFVASRSTRLCMSQFQAASEALLLSQALEAAMILMISSRSASASCRLMALSYTSGTSYRFRRVTPWHEPPAQI